MGVRQDQSTVNLDTQQKRRERGKQSGTEGRRLHTWSLVERVKCCSMQGNLNVRFVNCVEIQVISLSKAHVNIVKDCGKCEEMVCAKIPLSGSGKLSWS